MLEVLPDTVRAYREYLGTVPELTTLPDSSDRIPLSRMFGGALPSTTVGLPALRITELSYSADTRGWGRALTQIDVWHSAGRSVDGRAIAEVVRAALVASENHTTAQWVLGGVDAVTGASIAPFGSGLDEAFNPPVPRWTIVAGLLIRPN